MDILYAKQIIVGLGTRDKKSALKMLIQMCIQPHKKRLPEFLKALIF